MVTSVLDVYITCGSSIVTGGLGLIEDKVSLGVAILTCSIMVCGFGLGKSSGPPRLSSSVVDYYINHLSRPVCNLQHSEGLDAQRWRPPRLSLPLRCIFEFRSLLAGSTLADIWSIAERGMAIAYFAAAPCCGPAIRPIVTGWINVGTGHLNVFFWVKLAFAGFMLILVGLIPETYAPVILTRRAAAQRKSTGNQNIITEQEKISLHSRTSYLRISSVLSA
ncbi:hypothetical protein EYZ11_011682 [Aspergillus tanneri]|uniref:Major facilitator superfamily (MFS) profile domain-containing protein n=1 Tax=Aspergillus tanneri TaxID=1220188 RepID=A0A4V3UMW4_9EURO|nr:uncharacterized protein ATNIH1004_000124 [Aspergillus tanneri]KAA8651246.1 hypothetical protein ATNIH1004_000124 [Aspergillus tanneri]THC88874.1 hypothetical protein EYZ11_011682 [Aspergillus tanneri]